MIDTLTNSKRSLLCYYKRSRKLMALGLTSRGQPRKRQFLSKEEDRRRRLARWHARSERRTQRGLTTRGTPRKQAYRRGKYKSWLAFRAQVVVPPTWNDVLFLDSPTNNKRLSA